MSACLRTLVPTLRTLVSLLRTIVLVFENGPLAALTVGRSSVRQRILALLMDSGGRLHLREIQRRASTSPGTASRELAKLVGAGLIEREAEGNQVYFRASNSPFATMLRSLLVAMPEPEFEPPPSPLPAPKRRVSVTATPPSPRSVKSEISLAVASEVSSDDSVEAAADAPSSAAAAQAAHETAPAQGAAAIGDTSRVIRPGADVNEYSAPPLAVSPTPARSALPATHEAAPTSQAPESSSPASRPGPVLAEPERAAADLAASESAASPDPLGLLVAARLASSIRPIYGEGLRGVYLYGARASGSAAADQDVETIIVLDRVDRYGDELERTSDACAALSHELKIVVSRVFVSEARWNGEPDGLPPGVRSGAVAV